MTFEELTALNDKDLAENIGEMARGKIEQLPNSGTISGLIAETNAWGWGVDTMEVDAESVNRTSDGVSCSADVQFAGEQDEDKPCSGDIISGSVEITVDTDLNVEVETNEFEVEDY